MSGANGTSPHIIFFIDGSFIGRTSGYHSRAFGFLSYLRTQGWPVTVYSFANHHAHPWMPADRETFMHAFPGVPLVLEHRDRVARLFAKAKKLATALAPSYADRIAAFGPRRIAPQLAALRKEHPDALWALSHITTALDIAGVPLSRCTVDTIDLAFVQVAKLFGHPIYGRRVLQRFRIEMGLLMRTPIVISLAPPDAALLQLCLVDQRVLFVPDFGAGTASLPDRQNASGGRLLFVGSDNMFNIRGISAFIREHGALIARYGLDVAGKVSLVEEVTSASATAPNVRLLGFVDDLSAYYGTARALVSPVDGTGVKIKVLEGLAAGVPVFGSAHTRAGLPAGFEQCVFPLDATMPAILDDAEAVRRAGEAAIAYSAGIGRSAGLAELDTALHRLARGGS